MKGGVFSIVSEGGNGSRIHKEGWSVPYPRPSSSNKHPAPNSLLLELSSCSAKTLGRVSGGGEWLFAGLREPRRIERIGAQGELSGDLLVERCSQCLGTVGRECWHSFNRINGCSRCNDTLFWDTCTAVCVGRRLAICSLVRPPRRETG